MVLSTSAVTLMQLVDAVVLSRHSQAAVAAMGPASMLVILVQGVLFGTSGYVGVFASHHQGARDEAGLRQAAGLGWRFSLLAGLAALLLSWPASRVFLLAGHPPEVARAEMSYSAICLAGSFFPTLGSAFAGWLSGTGRPGLVTATTFVSLVANAFLAWALVLGRFGFPRLGMAGAAAATVIAQALGCLLHAFFLRRAGAFAAVHGERDPDRRELLRFLRLALPAGLRVSGEVFAWVAFLLFVGRIGQVELAASSIAFRINGTAFFPATGLGQAAGVLVGQARGAGRDRDVPGIAWQATALCELWMVAMAAVFFLAPEALFAPLAGTGPQAAATIAYGRTILGFVSLYCLFDAGNVVLGSVLSAAGDTSWVARAFLGFSLLFVLSLGVADRLSRGLAVEWLLATIFVGATAAAWVVRFQSGSWRSLRVVGESSFGEDRPG